MNSIELSLEKSFALKQFETTLQNASREQAIELAVEAYRLYLATKQTVSSMVKSEFTGLGDK